MKKRSSLLTAGIALFASALVSTAVMTSCNGNKGLTESGLDPAKFDTTINGKPVKLYVLKNSNDMEVCITNFGGRVVSIMVPNRNGAPTDVVLGYDNIAQYADSVNSPSDFGAAIGRYANRIKDGKFNVGGQTIQLPRNNYGHCLHGGFSGWQYQVYEVAEVNDSTLKLVMHSPDGDNNFPGNVTATVTYTVKNDNTLDIQEEATTDKETVINMTNHSYFNLSGDPSKAGTNMVLYINADSFTVADNTFMPTGEVRAVYGTPMDFNKRHPLYETIADSTFEQIKFGLGYDHNWVLNTYKNGKGNDAIVAAALYSPESGIQLNVYTTEPGIQVYTGNFLGAKVKGKKGIVYPQRASVCLKPQKFPNSPNVKKWVSPFLKPGEKYTSHIAYKFSVKE